MHPIFDAPTHPCICRMSGDGVVVVVPAFASVETDWKWSAEQTDELKKLGTDIETCRPLLTVFGQGLVASVQWFGKIVLAPILDSLLADLAQQKSSSTANAHFLLHIAVDREEDLCRSSKRRFRWSVFERDWAQCLPVCSLVSQPTAKPIRLWAVVSIAEPLRHSRRLAQLLRVDSSMASSSSFSLNAHIPIGFS